MIDLTTSPIYNVDFEAMELRVKTAIQDDGRAARRVGMPESKCPEYRIQEWKVWWLQGWRWQGEGM